MIKFRGLYNHDKKDFLYGDLVQIPNVDYALINAYDDSDVYFASENLGTSVSGFYEVTKDSVSQFTGLIDKNSVEIYEGDYYREGDYVFICTWVQERACFGWLTSEEREAYEAYSGCIPDDWSSMEFEDCKKITIAGNIFQKPSVLTDHLNDRVK